MKSTVICPETSAADICDPLITADDYAAKYDITRRTVDRYARSGKVERLRQGGKTFIVDKPPIKAETQSVLSETVQSDLVVAPVRNDWIAFGAAKAYASSRHKWQIAFFVVTLLFAVVSLAGTAAGIWLWQAEVITQNKLIATVARLAAIDSELTKANATLDTNQNAHNETEGGLRNQIKELRKANQGMVSQLVTLATARTDPNGLRVSTSTPQTTKHIVTTGR